MACSRRLTRERRAYEGLTSLRYPATLIGFPLIAPLCCAQDHRACVRVATGILGGRTGGQFMATWVTHLEICGEVTATRNVSLKRVQVEA
jgi:hypothetical protein